MDNQTNQPNEEVNKTNNLYVVLFFHCSYLSSELISCYYYKAKLKTGKTVSVTLLYSKESVQSILIVAVLELFTLILRGSTNVGPV